MNAPTHPQLGLRSCLPPTTASAIHFPSPTWPTGLFFPHPLPPLLFLHMLKFTHQSNRASKPNLNWMSVPSSSQNQPMKSNDISNKRGWFTECSLTLPNLAPPAIPQPYYNPLQAVGRTVLLSAIRFSWILLIFVEMILLQFCCWLCVGSYWSC